MVSWFDAYMSEKMKFKLFIFKHTQSMIEDINKLRQKSQEGNLDAQMLLLAKLFVDFDFNVYQPTELTNMCGKLRHANFYFLGMFHYLGIVETDDSNYKRTAENNNARNCAAFHIFNSFANSKTETAETYFIWNMLGLCYSCGIGTRECNEKARYWYQKSATGGNEFGCYNLGVVYEREGNLKLAMAEFEKAARVHKRAIIYLGNICLQLKDYEKAYHWYMKADLSNKSVPEALTKILSTGQIEWTLQNHKYWPSCQMDITIQKTTRGTQQMKRVTVFSFDQQLHTLLLISKFRQCSYLKYVQIFSKGVACIVVKHLAHMWVVE